MKTVYILRSISHLNQYYSGITGNMIERLNSHNAGKSPHTSKFRPWKLVLSIHFEDENKARSFEMYLKTGSGKAFARKRFL
jgi:predicted GIY-YIG superfamily endonuclease